MKILTKLALAAVILCSTFADQAGWVSGYTRSNGTYVAPYYRSDYGSLIGDSSYSGSSRDYVYRNPYAAYPSVHVNGYLSQWSHSFTRLFAVLRAALWEKLDLLKLLACYGTAGGSFRHLARPEQAYFPGFL
jgi:hypothetical protein